MPSNKPSAPTPQDRSDLVTDLFQRLGSSTSTCPIPESVAARARFLEAVKRRLLDEEDAQ